MSTLVGLAGLAFVLAGIIVFVMSAYRFIEDAVATNSSWAAFLFVPPTLFLISQLLAYWNFDAYLLSLWAPLHYLFLGIWFLGAGCLCVTPLAWLVCAVVCWRTTWKAVLSFVLSTSVVCLGFVAICYAAR